MGLIKTEDELKDFLPITEAFPISVILPYIDLVETEVIIPVIGETLFDSLKAAYDSDSLSADQDELLKKIRVPLANYALELGADVIGLQIGSLGFTKAKDESNEPMSSQDRYFLKRTLHRSGDLGMEHLLAYLEANKATWTDWTSDPVYQEHISVFITTARDFSTNYRRRISRWVYWNLRMLMKQSEKDILIGLISQEYYDELKAAIIADTVSAEDQKVIDRIKPCITHATMSRAIKNFLVTISRDGVTVFDQGTESKMAEVRKPAEEKLIESMVQADMDEANKQLCDLEEFLIENLADYPTFETNAYDEEEDENFENEEGSGFYFMG